MSFFVDTNNDGVYKDNEGVICSMCTKRFYKFKAEMKKFEDSLKLDDIVESITSDGRIIHHTLSRNSFPCNVCQSTFSSQHNLDLHRHFKDQSYSCDSCCRVYTAVHHLEYHKRSCHSKEIKTEKIVLESNQQGSSVCVRTTEFLCGVCNHSFVSKSHLDTHRYLTLKQFACNTCSDLFPSCFVLGQHRKICANKQVAVVKVTPEVTQHSFTSDVPESKFSCNKCNRKFSSKDDLDYHHELKLKPFFCDICCFVFANPLHLQKHKKKHASAVSTKNVVDKVREQFKQSCEVKKIKPEVTPRNTESSRARVPPIEFRCDVCNHTFVSKKNLDSHIHLALKRFNCDTCSDGFASCYLLGQHKQNCDATPKIIKEVVPEATQQHSRVYNILEDESHCSRCNKIFVNKETLDLHLQLSRNPFFCSNCCRVFAHSLHLKEHKKNCDVKSKIIEKVPIKDVKRSSLDSNVSKSEFLCSKCNIKFMSQDDLDSHLQLKLKPFFCDICCLVFANSLHLQEHKKNHSSAISSAMDKDEEQVEQVENKEL